MNRLDYLPVHTGITLPGMGKSALLAAAFHAAVGGAFWLDLEYGETAAALPVSDVIVVDLITIQPTEVTEETLMPVVRDVIPVVPDTPDTPSNPPLEVADQKPLPEVLEEETAPPLPVAQPKQVAVFDTPVRKPSVVKEVQERTTEERPVIENPVALNVQNQPIRLAETVSAPTVPSGTARESNSVNIAAVSYVQNPKPVYPREARRKRQEGVVLLRVEVSAAGLPLSVLIRESSGYRLLDQSALRAVRKWRFSPAMVGAVPVSDTVDVPIRFFLKNS